MDQVIPHAAPALHNHRCTQLHGRSNVVGTHTALVVDMGVSVAEQDPGSGAFLNPGVRDG